MAQIQHKRNIKAQIEIGISQENLVSIIVTEDNIAQLHFEDEHEFEYEGMMYDIVRTEILPDKKTVYYCIADREEANLMADFDKSFEKETNPQKESDTTAQLLAHLLSKVYLLTQNSFIFYCYFPKQLHLPAYPIQYHSPFLQKNFPPPKPIASFIVCAF